MRHTRQPDQPAMTRRDTLRLGVGLGAGWLARVSLAHTTQAQATPEATPATDAGDMLVDAAWLAANRDDPSVALVAFMPVEDFAKEHIPGSVQLDWPVLEVIDTSDESIAAWRETVEQLLTSLGISRNHTVVAYDAGTLFAARFWWVLHYLGHGQVRVLNGGFAAWQEQGNEIEAGDGEPAAPAAEPYRGEPRPDALAQLVEVRARIDDPEVVFVDTRTADEYAAGHIPGAVNINYPLNALPDAPKFWKPASELMALYEEHGVTPDRLVIPYCTTGVRSAVTFFSLRLIGYPAVSLYTGSWKEWESHPETPKETGNPA